MKSRFCLSGLLGLLVGCSTHPMTDVYDYFRPGKMYPNTVTPYGGVGIQQGAYLPQAPGLPIGGAPLGPIPGGAVVPPPAPLPGNRPPLGVQLQTPQPGEVPPLPPTPPPSFGR